MSFFQTHPVSQLVQKATSEYLLGPDWALNMEICDHINRGGDDAPKHAVKTIRKQMKNKNAKVAILALTVAETCVKNCSTSLHRQVASSDFMKDLVKIIEKKADVGVTDKALELIQSWAEAFKNNRHFPQFVETYESLRRAGYRFPARNMDALAPVNTPAPTAGAPPPSRHVQQQHQQHQQQQGVPAPGRGRGHPPPSAPGYHNARPVDHGHQRAARGGHGGQRQHAAPPAPRRVETNPQKLQADLKVVRETTQLLSEMLDAHNPAEDVRGNDLITELVSTCQQIGPRLVDLIQNMEDPAMMSTLLEYNDDVQRCLTNYEKLKRGERVDSAAIAAQIANNDSGATPAIPAPAAGGGGATPAAQPEGAVADLLGLGFDEPAPQPVQQQQQQSSLQTLPPIARQASPQPQQQAPPAQQQSSLLDDDFATLGLAPATTTTTTTTPSTTSTSAAAAAPALDDFDLLATRGSTGGEQQPPRLPALGTPVQAAPQPVNNNPFGDVLAPAPTPSPQQQQPQAAAPPAPVSDDFGDEFDAIASRNTAASAPFTNSATPAPAQPAAAAPAQAAGAAQAAPAPVDEFDEFLNMRAGKA